MKVADNSTMVFKQINWIVCMNAECIHAGA